MRFSWLSLAVWGIVDLIFYFCVVQVLLFFSFLTLWGRGKV